MKRKIYTYIVLALATVFFVAFSYRQYALNMARNSSSSIALQQLSKEFWVIYDPEVRSALALNKATPADILGQLMSDRLVVVRKAAASNPLTPATGLRAILTTLDGSPEVKLNIVQHPNTPCDVLQQLASDSNDRIQQVAAQRLDGCTKFSAMLPSGHDAAIDAPAIIKEQDISASASAQGTAALCNNLVDLWNLAHSNCVSRMRDQLAANKGILGSLRRLAGKDERTGALIVAIDRNHADIARLLLDDGLDPDKRSSENESPLIRAAFFGRTDIVNALLDHGADINQRGAKTPDEERSALIRAVESDKADTVEALLARGAAPLLADYYGWTAIHYAAKDGHRQSLEALVAHGVDVNLRIKTGDHTGQTPLLAAAYFGHARTLAWLLEHGADTALYDRYGYTALRLARERANTDAVAVLSKAEETRTR